MDPVHWFCLQGDYVRLWVPELQGIKGADIHTPWALSSAALSQAGVTLGETYPQPVVTAPEWSRHIHQRPVSTGRAGMGVGVLQGLLCLSLWEFCSSFPGVKGKKKVVLMQAHITSQQGLCSQDYLAVCPTHGGEGCKFLLLLCPLYNQEGLATAYPSEHPSMPWQPHQRDGVSPRPPPNTGGQKRNNPVSFLFKRWK